MMSDEPTRPDPSVTSAKSVMPKPAYHWAVWGLQRSRWLTLLFSCSIFIQPAYLIWEQFQVRAAIAKIEAASGVCETDDGWLSKEWVYWAYRQDGWARDLVLQVHEWQETARAQSGWNGTFATCYRRLTNVNLGGPAVDDAFLGVLPKRYLKSISLDSCPVRGWGLRYLTECPRLTEIHLRFVPLDSSDVASVRWPVQLQYFGAMYCDLTDEALRSLAGCEHLETVQLDSNQLTGSGLHHLRELKTLRTLTLSQNPFAGELEFPPNVTWLALDQLPDGERTFGPLPASLDDLWLQQTQVNDQMMDRISDLKQLMTLFLDDTGIADAALKKLPRSLEDLRLERTEITNAGVQHLSTLKNLEHLHLRACLLIDR